MADGKVGWATGGFCGGDRGYGMWLGFAEGCTMDLGSGWGSTRSGDDGNGMGGDNGTCRGSING